MNEFYEIRFGKHTLQENLARAIAGGKLLKTEEGKYLLPSETPSDQYLQIKTTCRMSCQFLNKFLFQHAYDKNAVPYGCQTCYKVKIVPKDFRGLIALRATLEVAPYHSKCGIDLFNRYSRDIYAGFLYLKGLDAARKTYKDMQDRIDAHPDLAGQTLMTIKRGCSDYEAACGSSNLWEFRDGMEALEKELKSCFQEVLHFPVEYRVRRMKSMVNWLQIAYSLRDDSYLAFTDGKPLHQSSFTYTVDEL